MWLLFSCSCLGCRFLDELVLEFNFYNPDCGSLCLIYYTVLWQRLSIYYIKFCHLFCPQIIWALLLDMEGFIMNKGRVEKYIRNEGRLCFVR